MSKNIAAITPSPKRVRALAESLVDWYREEARDLPWRHTRDPYAIWVSEVMLQQTRVEVVIGRWQPFLDRFPTVSALASADQADVLAEWAGLGYYRRARQLHDASRRIVEVYGSHLPQDSATLRMLPGFGAYTAGAVASIAFGESVPAVDGNVERVMARLLALSDDPRRGEAARRVRATATALLEFGAAADVNQALMELGATTCTPRKPSCEACPWRSACRAEAQGRAELFPVKPARRPSIEVASYAALIRDDRGWLWRQRPEGVVNAGLWELPTTDWHPGAADSNSAREGIEDLGRRYDLVLRVGDPVARARHSITHHRVTVTAHTTHLEAGEIEATESLRWAEVDAARAWGLTAATSKLLPRLPSLI